MQEEEAAHTGSGFNRPADVMVKQHIFKWNSTKETLYSNIKNSSCISSKHGPCYQARWPQVLLLLLMKTGTPVWPLNETFHHEFCLSADSLCVWWNTDQKYFYVANRVITGFDQFWLMQVILRTTNIETHCFWHKDKDNRMINHMISFLLLKH